MRVFLFALLLFIAGAPPVSAANSTLGGVNIVTGQPCPQNGDTVFDDSATHIVVCTGGVWTTWSPSVGLPLNADTAPASKRLIGINSGVDPYMGFYGTSNTYVGYQAGKGLDGGGTGSYNTLIGHQAGKTAATTFASVFVGENAGGYVTGGTYNVAIGTNAGKSINGDYNVLIGSNAGNAATSGASNVIIGFNTFRTASSIGAYNVVLGTEAGEGAGTAYSTIIGGQAGRGATGQRNTMVGYQAGTATTTGANNTFFGYQAGDLTKAGSRNIIIGSEADAPAATTNDYLNIGNAIYGVMDTNGTSAIGDNEALITIDGNLKLGGTGSETCDGSNGGRMRYNPSTKKMQYCNETAWVDM